MDNANKVNLRDYYAGLAMQSIINKTIVKKHSIWSKIRVFFGYEGYKIDFDLFMAKIAKASYEMSDAMLNEKSKVMNIYALKGHKIKFVNPTSGYQYEQDTAKAHLIIGKEYTVEQTSVGSWHTEVYIEEVPDVGFNSCLFEDVSNQSVEDDKKHSDYYKYH